VNHVRLFFCAVANLNSKESTRGKSGDIRYFATSIAAQKVTVAGLARVQGTSSAALVSTPAGSLATSATSRHQLPRRRSRSWTRQSSGDLKCRVGERYQGGLENKLAEVFVFGDFAQSFIDVTSVYLDTPHLHIGCLKAKFFEQAFEDGVESTSADILS
jgi:hypothetical protein